MTIGEKRVAIVFPADETEGVQTLVERSRFAEVSEAILAASAEVISAPFAEEMAAEIEARLTGVDAALVRYNPNEGGRDRSALNSILRAVADKGVMVSAHPDVIDKMGTKEVLYRTRDMGWGCDTRRYSSINAMRTQMAGPLRKGARVLKQMRGQSGDGVWKVALADHLAPDVALSADTMVRARHAKRGAVEQTMPLGAFLDVCRPYFAAGNAMIDQPYQPRLHEGMIRCYVVRDRVEGFGDQLINALYPAPEGRQEWEAPQPGPRHYFPPDRADLQALKQKLEQEWIPQMRDTLGLTASELPVLWDADFLLGPKDGSGADTHVLCEINVSSVYPFPPSALAPLVAEALERIH